MGTSNSLLKVLGFLALGAGLTGCPLSAPKEAAPIEEQAAVAPQPAGVLVGSEGDQYSLYEFFRRRIFINGKEVQFTGLRSSIEGSGREAHSHGHRAVASKLRMLLTDPRFEAVLDATDSHGNSLGQLIRRLLGFGGEFTVSRVLVNILSVEVRLEGVETWQTVVDFGATGHVIDLMSLSQGALLEMGTFALAPGKYTRMRLNLSSNNQVEVDEGHGLVLKPLRTPSRAHERIDLITPFTILESGLTTLMIDFDVKDSIRRWFGSYLITPKLKIVSVSTASTVKKMISAAQGGVVGVFGEIVVSIPPEALSEDTEVSITPILRLTPHETDDLIVVGHEYAIGPADVTLLKPAHVSLAYEPLYASHMGLNPDYFDLFSFNATTREWSSTLDPVERGAKEISTTISSFGNIAVGAAPLADPTISGPGCVGYSDSVAIQPINAGIDLQFFAAACNRQELCYQHGFRTYRQEASACNDTLKVESAARCEDLCRGETGKACSQLTSEELVAAPTHAFTAVLYENCLAQADNLYQAAQALVADRYPGQEQSTCLDYEGKGISCEPASCTVSVDKASVKKGVPSDLTFLLRVVGSVEVATFDGTVAFQQDSLALPVDQTIMISEVGRILDEPRTFSAVVTSPSGVPTSCSATVEVVKDPDPCTITMTPNPVVIGQLAGLFLKAAPGFDSAKVDYKIQGDYVAVALSAPDSDGYRTYFSNQRLRDPRTYSALVTNGAGEVKSCSVAVTVLPVP